MSPAWTGRFLSTVPPGKLLFSGHLQCPRESANCLLEESPKFKGSNNTEIFLSNRIEPTCPGWSRLMSNSVAHGHSGSQAPPFSSLYHLTGQGFSDSTVGILGWIILGCALQGVYQHPSEVAGPGLKSCSQIDVALGQVASVCPSRSPVPFPTFLSAPAGTNGPPLHPASPWPVEKERPPLPSRSAVG